jgi:phage protein U
MQYAILGNIQFDLITYFSGLDGKFGAEFAEHARLAKKPKLQFTGDKLDEWSLTLSFHVRFCNPEAELAKLIAAMRTHKALPFVLGNGDYKGSFVIAEIGSQAKQTDPKGYLTSVEATLTLREVADAPKPEPAKPAVLKSGAKAPAQAVTGAQRQGPALRQATAGRAVLSAGQVAQQAVAVFRTASILAAQGSVGSAADRAMAGLGTAAGVLAGYGGSMAGPAQNIVSQAMAARALFVGITAVNHAQRGAQAGAAMASIAVNLAALGPQIARTVADVATRKVA